MIKAAYLKLAHDAVAVFDYANLIQSRAIGNLSVKYKFIREDNGNPIILDLRFALKFLYQANLEFKAVMPDHFWKRCADANDDLAQWIMIAPKLKIHSFTNEEQEYCLKVKLPEGIFAITLTDILTCLWMTGEEILKLPENYFLKLSDDFPILNQRITTYLKKDITK